MKISVIVPTFNRAQMLSETIDAVLGQTFNDFELIVVDNFSTDGTERVARKYHDKRIRFFRNENGGVVAVNRNYGIERAGGEYIAFCDDDDLWLPDKLKRQLQEFEKDPQLALVCANATMFGDAGELGLFHDTKLSAVDFGLDSLLRTNRIICSSVLVKKSVIDDVGMMDTSRDIFSAEDYELWLRIAARYPVKYIDAPLVRYRVHAGGYKKSSAAALQRNRAVYRKLLNKGVINSGKYRRLCLRAWAIEFLWRTRTIRIASGIKRLLNRSG